MNENVYGWMYKENLRCQDIHDVIVEFWQWLIVGRVSWISKIINFNGVCVYKSCAWVL